MQFHLSILIAAAVASTNAAAAGGSDEAAAVRRILLQSADRMAESTLLSMSSSTDECAFVASLAARAQVLGLRAELALAIATCVNEESATPQKYMSCLEDAFDSFAEGIQEVRDQNRARHDLCMLTGGGIYDPDLDEDEFPEGVDHRFLPFRPGATWVYRKQTDEGLEEITVTVLDETTEVDDVDVIAVSDIVTLDGEVVEDTIDWYAQHEDGTVWYLGEISVNYEDGQIADLDGSWKAGEQGALPGIVMLAHPTVGTTYRQELLLTEAEDAATVLATNAVVTIGLGTFTGCLQTEDFTPLSPGSIEHKFYAPDIGLVLETVPGTSERLELVSFTPGR
jgi:hypothetical protein